MIQYKEGRTLPIEDFSPGLRTTGIHFARVNTSPKTMNFRSGKDRLLRKRPGFDYEIQGISNVPVTGLYEYGIGVSNRKQVAHIGSNIYKMDNYDGNWDILQTGIASNITSEFDTFTSTAGNILLHCTHNNDPLHYWAGSDTTMTSVTSSGAPAPKYIKVWQNHVWAAGIAANPSRLRYSNVATYSEWQTDGIDNYDDNFQTRDGDYITGLGVLRGNLYVFKRHSIFRVTYLGGTPLINVLQVVDDVGAVSSKTICEGAISITGDNGVTSIKEVLMFLTADKQVVAFDGSTIYPLTDQVAQDNFYSPISMQTLNDAALSEAHAIYYSPEDSYILFAANSSYNTATHAIVINTKTRGIYTWDNMAFRSSTVRITENNQQVPMMGSYTGEFYRFWWGSKDRSATFTSGLVSLLHFEGEDNSIIFTDNAGRIWTPVSGALIDTAKSKFGASSMYLDGVDDFLYTDPSTDFDFSGGIWTFDAQVYPEALTTERVIYSQGTDGNNYFEIVLTSNEVKLRIQSSGSTVVEVTTSGANITTGAWFEIRVAESGNNFYIFVNGSLLGTGTDTDRAGVYTGRINLGFSANGSPRVFQGWIDEVRVLKGAIASTVSYTANTRAYDSRAYSDVNIACYYETDLIDLKATHTLKKGRNLIIYVKPRSSTTITISRAASYEYAFRESRGYVTTSNTDPLGTEMILGTGVLGGDYGALLSYDVPETAGFIRFRIYETSTLESFIIQRLDFVDDVLGLGNSVLSGVTVS